MAPAGGADSAEPSTDVGVSVTATVGGIVAGTVSAAETGTVAELVSDGVDVATDELAVVVRVVVEERLVDGVRLVRSNPRVGVGGVVSRTAMEGAAARASRRALERTVTSRATNRRMQRGRCR